MERYRQFCAVLSIGIFFLMWSYMTAAYGIVFGLVIGLFVAFALSVICWWVMLLPVKFAKNSRRNRLDEIG